jgi:hypothetical protein
MTTNKTIKLPKTINELQDAIQRAITSFQGSPAKNPNKLRTALAKSLNFNNYDELSALIKSNEDENKQLGLSYALLELKDDSYLNLFICEVGLYSNEDHSSLIHVFDIVVASEDKESASTCAEVFADNNIKKIHGEYFKTINDIEDYDSYL